MQALPHLDPPEDNQITTLYCGGLGESVVESEIRDSFYAYGEIRSVTMVPKQGCAFVQFTSRPAAEKAAEATFNKLVIRGNKITIRYASDAAVLTVTIFIMALDFLIGI